MMKTKRTMLTVVMMIAAIAVLFPANPTNAALLLDEDFQTDPLMGNNISLNSESPNPYPGWSYEDGSLKSRTEATADLPGDAGVAANQAMQQEWNNREAWFDLGHAWSADDVYTLTFNAAPQAWNIASARWVRPRILEGNAVLWDPGETAATKLYQELADPNPWAWNGPGPYGNGVWQDYPETLFSFTINAADFTAGTEGSNIRLELDSSGQRGVYFDNVSLELVEPQGDTEVPEPATMALLSLAACGLGGYVRRRRKA